jgi:hypothetical protein
LGILANDIFHLVDELDLGAAPFRAAAARRVIFIGGGGVTKMSAAAASAASTKNLLCRTAANSKFNPILKDCFSSCAC